MAIATTRVDLAVRPPPSRWRSWERSQWRHPRSRIYLLRYLIVVAALRTSQYMDLATWHAWTTHTRAPQKHLARSTRIHAHNHQKYTLRPAPRKDVRSRTLQAKRLSHAYLVLHHVPICRGRSRHLGPDDYGVGYRKN